MLRPLNVLFIVNSLNFGGAEKHVVALLNNLDTRHFKLSLACLKDGTELLPQLKVDRLERGVEFCGVSSRLDREAVHRVGELIDAGNYDVVVCTNCYPLIYATLARWHTSQKFSLIEVFHTTEMNGWKEQLKMLLYRPFFAFSDLLIYVCDNQRAFWKRRLLTAKSTEVIHNGIDVEYFKDNYEVGQKVLLRRSFGFTDEDLVIGLCAVMRPEKAHRDLLLAIAELRRRGLPAKALLIGDGVERANIEKQIVEFNLSDHVKITGFMSDVRPLIASCDAMSLVSHYVETFSIAALEAMALGKPMIMSRIGGASEQVVQGVNGFLFERGDWHAMAGFIEELFDRERCAEMGRAARAGVLEKFSIDAMTDRFASAFKRKHGERLRFVTHE